MFNTARIKLTSWYLLIIMFICIVFSITIYEGADTELRRIQGRQQFRMQQLRDEFFIQPGAPELFEPVPIEDLRDRLILSLFLINLGILALSGVAGYFLAGRTLEPIQEMVDEQNRFITDASHELRTPITVLKSELEVSLRDKKLTLAEAKQLLESNLEEVNNLQVMSDQLLELTQIQKPTQLLLETFSLKELVQAVYKKTSPLAKQKKITLEVKAPTTQIEADKARLTEVLVILIDNAVKYSPSKTTIRLTANAIKQTAIIHVKDEGIGIAKEDLPHIFDRFYRADKSRTKTDVFGYGLGLSIAKKNVEQHNGRIHAQSTVNKGTEITVEIPLKQARKLV